MSSFQIIQEEEPDSQIEDGDGFLSFEDQYAEMIQNQLGKLFDEYVQGKNTYPDKTREFDIVKKPGAAKKVKLTLGQ